MHIFPYWDFNDGQFIDVRVCSNAPVVELIFNGKSQGICTLDAKSGKQLAGHWHIPYEEGELRAVACDEEGNEIAEDVQHSFKDAEKICLKASESELLADGEDLLFVEISMRDKDGYPVQNANNRVWIEAEGAGVLVGTDNGDSTDTEQYTSGSRRLFSGKLLAVFKTKDKAGDLKIRVSSAGMKTKELVIPVKEAKVREGISLLAYEGVRKAEPEKTEDVEVRNIYLESENGLHLHEENQETIVKAHFSPANAKDKELIWSIVDDAGIPLKIATIEEIGYGRVKVTAKSDGNFRLRCMSKSGTDHICIISSLEFIITGLGKAFTDPYEFVSAGLYNYSKGEIGNGNEHGVATARDGESQVGFRNIDFGVYGSDEITVPVFALTDDPYEIEIYEGMPDEGGSLLGKFIYQKPKMWNVYQLETFHLNKRLRGISEICFVLREKVHIKGFWFKRYNRAWQTLVAGECDKIYGDSFERAGEEIHQIGNNVTICFEQMDFGEKGTKSLVICGSTPLEKNTIILKFAKDGVEEQRMVEFMGTKTKQSFEIEPIYGVNDVSLVFLPGSNFNFTSICFCEA